MITKHSHINILYNWTVLWLLELLQLLLTAAGSYKDKKKTQPFKDRHTDTQS